MDDVGALVCDVDRHLEREPGALGWAGVHTQRRRPCAAGRLPEAEIDRFLITYDPPLCQKSTSSHSACRMSTQLEVEATVAPSRITAGTDSLVGATDSKGVFTTARGL